MTDPFVHLHVASGYSLRYGASHPHVLVERAVEHEMDALALTDRDGLYGAVRFVNACSAAGIRPILGADLAFARGRSRPGQPPSGRPDPRPRTPVRGGAYRDPRLPRVTFLASGRSGWAALCRLVSATHLTGERGEPVCTPELVAEHLGGHLGGQLGGQLGRDVLVLLGPASELGEAVTRRRDDLGLAELERWQQLVGPGQLLVEVVSHRLPGAGPGTAPHAARMLALARRRGVPAVLSNAVRHADRLDAPTVDVLDAARRLVPLDRRHLDRGNAEGFLKSGKQMHEVAEEICRYAGLGDSEVEARRLLAHTRAVADRCMLDPRGDLGIGEVHFPEFEVAAPGSAQADADAALRARCEAAIGWRYGTMPRQRIWKRLDDELQVIGRLGYASYFLTVADVTDLVRELGIRCAARGSGAGSLVNHLLGISGIDPIRHNLLMERFLSPLRASLPDIDLDVESARRLEVYDAILERYGDQRCVAVSMMDSYRVRHAVRDVGAALGMPPGEVDAIAKAFPHIRARDARMALRDLPELRAAGLDSADLDQFFRLVESLDGLPRHVAMHPCGVLLSDATLLDRTPVERSFLGYPMSQFDKDDVEDLGLLKLDVLGIRMQSSMAHAVAEIRRVEGVEVDIDDEAQVPLDDPATYQLISSSRTLGVFQIESPGQRELVGKSGIDDFTDIITDISLFRPGPVKSDMITPYLDAKQGWRMPAWLHDDLRPILGETHGVVVFHEQVIEMIAQFAGCTNAEADEARRALGDAEGMAEVRAWFFPRALGRGYPVGVVERIWKVLEGFASFGFCKAHAAAFALPTYQSAWLKTHYPAYFLAGVLTHDPGMYPKRLILDDARQFGIPVLPLDVNASEKEYAVEPVGDRAEGVRGIRLALGEVRGINDGEVERIVTGRPWHSLSDFWHRARVSRPVVERLVMAGAFDTVYGIGSSADVRRRHRVTRRDLLLQVGDLDRHQRLAGSSAGPGGSVQLTLDLGDEPREGEASHLPEMTDADRVRAELDVLGLDVSHHVLDFHAPFLEALGVTRSADLLRRRSRAELLVAGVKVATQTPPIRSGRRVVFLTLDDATGPVDATFFEDAQGPYAATVFGSWLLVVRGVLRRTGRRGVSLRATGAWDLGALHELWRREGIDAVHAAMAEVPAGFGEQEKHRVLVHSSGFRMSPYADVRPAGASTGVVTGEVARRLWHRSPGSAG
ncbi:MAG TPA: DNA polymerase III subunit alpha [Marmoricola sp.]